MSKPPTNYRPAGGPAQAALIPRPVGLVGPNKPSPDVPAPSDNRVQAPSQYAQSAELRGDVDVRLSPKTVMNVNWKVPTTFTVYSQLPYDIYQNLFADDPPGSSVFDHAQVRLVVTWGDSNGLYQRDVPCWTPLTFTGTYLKIDAYIIRYAVYPGNAFPDLTAALATLQLLAVEGDASNDVSRPIDNLQLTSAIEAGTWGEGFPSTLLGFSGYQENGTVVYMMLFDHSENGDFIADGSVPIYQFRVPDGENFSVSFGEGLTFIHGGAWVASSTPSNLTRIPTTVPGAVNVQFISNAPGGFLYAEPPQQGF